MVVSVTISERSVQNPSVVFDAIRNVYLMMPDISETLSTINNATEIGRDFEDDGDFSFDDFQVEVIKQIFNQYASLRLFVINAKGELGIELIKARQQKEKLQGEYDQLALEQIEGTNSIADLEQRIGDTDDEQLKKQLEAEKTELQKRQAVINALVEEKKKALEDASEVLGKIEDASRAQPESIRTKVEAAIRSLFSARKLDLGFLVMPSFHKITIEDRYPIFFELDELAKRKKWIHFANIETTDPRKAIEEAGVYKSEQGFSSVFYGFITHSGQDIPLSVFAAAIAAQSSADGVEKPPAGINYPLNIPEGSERNPEAALKNLIVTNTDLASLNSSAINVFQQIPVSLSRGLVQEVLCLWGSRTLSSKEVYRFINTRAIINRVSQRLQLALAPYNLEAYDPKGTTTNQVKLIITSIMEDAYANNYLSGTTSSEAYTVRSKTEDASPPGSDQVGSGNRVYKITVQVFARFVGTTEQIEVELYPQ
ncbi:MAG: hypothetical protein F6J98_02155 [Moorea sp. SIO4G2]|nr:hypothetical protein [Moorena sp. SIO4G2]